MGVSLRAISPCLGRITTFPLFQKQDFKHYKISAKSASYKAFIRELQIRKIFPQKFIYPSTKFYLCETDGSVY